jgi:hypothetical protein
MPPEPRVDDLAPKFVRGVVVTYGIEVASRAGSVETVDVQVDIVDTEELAEHLGDCRSVRPVRSGERGTQGLAIVIDHAARSC